MAVDHQLVLQLPGRGDLAVEAASQRRADALSVIVRLRECAGLLTAKAEGQRVNAGGVFIVHHAASVFKVEAQPLHAHAVFGHDVGLARNARGRGRGKRAVGAQQLEAVGQRLKARGGLGIGGQRRVRQEGIQLAPERAENFVAAVRIELLVAGGDDRQILVRQAEAELAAHAVEGKAAVGQHPELIAVARALVHAVVIDAVVDLL